MPPRAGDPDVEQPALLGERVGIGGRLADRQGAFLQPGQEDGVPLESLGPMEGRERDALAARVGLGGIAPRKLGEEVGDRGVGPLSLERPGDGEQRAQRRVAVARLGARAGGAASSKPSSVRQRSRRCARGARRHRP